MRLRTTFKTWSIRAMGLTVRLIFPIALSLVFLEKLHSDKRILETSRRKRTGKKHTGITGGRNMPIIVFQHELYISDVSHNITGTNRVKEKRQRNIPMQRNNSQKASVFNQIPRWSCICKWIPGGSIEQMKSVNLCRRQIGSGRSIDSFVNSCQ